MDGLTIVSHPLVQHKLTLLRDKTSSIQLFRAVVRETAALLCYEVTRDLPVETVRIETPIAATDDIGRCRSCASRPRRDTCPDDRADVPVLRVASRPGSSHRRP